MPCVGKTGLPGDNYRCLKRSIQFCLNSSIRIMSCFEAFASGHLQLSVAVAGAGRVGRCFESRRTFA